MDTKFINFLGGVIVGAVCVGSIWYKTDHFLQQCYDTKRPVTTTQSHWTRT